MPDSAGHVLVVDDNIINRKQLGRLLGTQGYAVTLAEHGRQAVELLSGGTIPFDVILLDILMPELDGFEVLGYVKTEPHLRHIPVIMISALDEMDSVVRCIELGATDFLPKPFNPALLHARLKASLAEKRLRDLELEYLEQAGRVADAAQEVEAGKFDPVSLNAVAGREDALGRLARVFQRMAREVHLREQRLHRQLEQLRLDMEEMARGQAERATAYLPMDRQQALIRNETLPDRDAGAALFADISGFTPLTAALTKELGLRRGAEELTRAIDQVYDALVNEVHRYGGSVIGFAGDSITCWLTGDDGRRALACALAMQEAMGLCKSMTTPAGNTFYLSVKVAVVAGPARRFLPGDPEHQVIEVVAGHTLDRLAAGEHCANRGEVVAGPEITEQFGEHVTIAEWRTTGPTGERFAVVTGLTELVPPAPWPAIPAAAIPDSACRPWVLPAVYERMRVGGRQFMADLRPVAALFANFKGIDYDADEDAGTKLDAYVRWAESVATRFDGALVQVTMGDKGSYFCIVFGAPLSHHDDEIRAVRAARAIVQPPPEFNFIQATRIGIAAGLARAGAYGSDSRRCYGVQGERINLAARLMQAAGNGEILCDETVYKAARSSLRFETLAPIMVKGRAEPLPIYRPLQDVVALEVERSEPASIRDRIDRLLPSEQLVLKVASILGPVFSLDLLTDIFPVDSERPHLGDRLSSLERAGILARQWPDEMYAFPDTAVQEAAYNSMLFVQRRTLHRNAAEWYERAYAGRLEPYYTVLAEHWRAGEETARSIDYLEKAAERARVEGDLGTARRLYERSAALEAEAGVLSASYYGENVDRAGPDFDGALNYAFSRLERELSPSLHYHNFWHTIEDVLPSVRRLASMSDVGPDETRLLEIAASYHDLGFLVDREEHERAGTELAAQVLPGFGFTSEQVATIQGMILATRLPQSPRTPLEEIICDADLDVLGRQDFLPRSEALRAESAAFGRIHTEADWYARQARFLVNHRYFTEAARELRNAGKQQNIATLEALLASFKQKESVAV